MHRWHLQELNELVLIIVGKKNRAKEPFWQRRNKTHTHTFISSDFGQLNRDAHLWFCRCSCRNYMCYSLFIAVDMKPITVQQQYARGAGQAALVCCLPTFQWHNQSKQLSWVASVPLMSDGRGDNIMPLLTCFFTTCTNLLTYLLVKSRKRRHTHTF